VKVTGLSITDEQIRAMQKRTGWKGRAARDQQVIATALSTPKWLTFNANKREATRALCADWLHAYNDIPDVFAGLFPAKDKKKIKPIDPDRALAAAEVLAAVWLSNFELETKVSAPPIADRGEEDRHVWITVKIHVPALDIDMWLDGTHDAHPDNVHEDE
jgi:hypothetical protein